MCWDPVRLEPPCFYREDALTRWTETGLEVYRAHCRGEEVLHTWDSLPARVATTRRRPRLHCATIHQRIVPGADAKLQGSMDTTAQHSSLCSCSDPDTAASQEPRQGATRSNMFGVLAAMGVARGMGIRRSAAHQSPAQTHLPGLPSRSHSRKAGETQVDDGDKIRSCRVSRDLERVRPGQCSF